MVSQRYLLVSRFSRKFFHDIGRYIVLVYATGILVLYVGKLLTLDLVVYWIFASVFIIYFIWMLNNRTYKVVDELEK